MIIIIKVGNIVLQKSCRHKKTRTKSGIFLDKWRNGRGSNPRPPAWQAGILTIWTTAPRIDKLGSNLLSHKRTLHYHRRNCISLLCSEWEQVVLQHYGRQAYRVKKLKKYKLFQLVFIANSRCLPGLYGQDVQIISIGKLHSSRSFHIQPINVVVCNGLYWLIVRDDSSWGLLPA